MSILYSNYPTRHNPSTQAKKAEVGLSKVDNLSLSELSNIITDNLKTQSNRRVLGELINDYGDVYLGLLKITDPSSLTSANIGIYNADKEIASFNISFGYTAPKEGNVNSASLSYLLEVTPNSSALKDVSLSFFYNEGLYVTLHCLDYSSGNSRPFDQIGIGLLQWTPGTTLLDNSDIKKLHNPANELKTIILDHNSSSINSAGSESFMIYNRDGNPVSIKKSYLTKDFESGNINVPTINDVPFLLDKNVTINNIAEAGRHITIPAKHKGATLEEAGEHDWEVLSKVRSTIGGEIPNDPTNSFGVARMAQEPGEIQGEINIKTLNNWIQTINKGGNNGDSISLRLFKNFCNYLLLVLNHDFQKIDGATVFEENETIENVFILKNQNDEFKYVEPETTECSISFDTYKIINANTLESGDIKTNYEENEVKIDVTNNSSWIRTTSAISNNIVTINCTIDPNSGEERIAKLTVSLKTNNSPIKILAEQKLEIIQKKFIQKFVLIGEDHQTYSLERPFEIQLTNSDDSQELEFNLSAGKTMPDSTGYSTDTNINDIKLLGEGTDWCGGQIVNFNRSEKTFTFKLSAIKNTTEEIRSHNFFVSLLDSENKELGIIPIYITQDIEPGNLSISTNEITTGKEQTTLSFNVTSNYTFYINTNKLPDWISEIRQRSDKGTEVPVFIEVTNNNLNQTRTTNLEISILNGTVTQTLKIIQTGRDTYFDIVGYENKDIQLPIYNLSPLDTSTPNKYYLKFKTDSDWIIDHLPSFIEMNKTFGGPTSALENDDILEIGHIGYEWDRKEVESEDDYTASDYISISTYDTKTNELVCLRKIYLYSNVWRYWGDAYPRSIDGIYLAGELTKEVLVDNPKSLQYNFDIEVIRSIKEHDFGSKNYSLFTPSSRDTQIRIYSINGNTDETITSQFSLYFNTTSFPKGKLNCSVFDYQDYDVYEYKYTSYQLNLTFISNDISPLIPFDEISQIQFKFERPLASRFVNSDYDTSNELITVVFKQKQPKLVVSDGGQIQTVDFNTEAIDITVKDNATLYITNETIPGWISLPNEFINNEKTLNNKFSVPLAINDTSISRTFDLELCSENRKENIQTVSISQRKASMATQKSDPELLRVIPVLKNKLRGVDSNQKVEIKLFFEYQESIQKEDGFITNTYFETPIIPNVYVTAKVKEGEEYIENSSVYITKEAGIYYLNTTPFTASDDKKYKSIQLTANTYDSAGEVYPIITYLPEIGYEIKHDFEFEEGEIAPLTFGFSSDKLKREFEQTNLILYGKEKFSVVKGSETQEITEGFSDAKRIIPFFDEIETFVSDTTVWNINEKLNIQKYSDLFDSSTVDVKVKVTGTESSYSLIGNVNCEVSQEKLIETNYTLLRVDPRLKQDSTITHTIKIKTKTGQPFSFSISDWNDDTIINNIGTSDPASNLEYYFKVQKTPDNKGIVTVDEGETILTYIQRGSITDYKKSSTSTTQNCVFKLNIQTEKNTGESTGEEDKEKKIVYFYEKLHSDKVYILDSSISENNISFNYISNFPVLPDYSGFLSRNGGVYRGYSTVSDEEGYYSYSVSPGKMYVGNNPSTETETGEKILNYENNLYIPHRYDRALLINSDRDYLEPIYVKAASAKSLEGTYWNDNANWNTGDDAINKGLKITCSDQTANFVKDEETGLIKEIYVRRGSALGILRFYFDTPFGIEIRMIQTSSVGKVEFLGTSGISKYMRPSSYFGNNISFTRGLIWTKTSGLNIPDQLLKFDVICRAVNDQGELITKTQTISVITYVPLSEKPVIMEPKPITNSTTTNYEPAIVYLRDASYGTMNPSGAVFQWNSSAVEQDSYLDNTNPNWKLNNNTKSSGYYYYGSRDKKLTGSITLGLKGSGQYNYVKYTGDPTDYLGKNILYDGFPYENNYSDITGERNHNSFKNTNWTVQSPYSTKRVKLSLKTYDETLGEKTKLGEALDSNSLVRRSKTFYNYFYVEGYPSPLSGREGQGRFDFYNYVYSDEGTPFTNKTALSLLSSLSQDFKQYTNSEFGIQFKRHWPLIKDVTLKITADTGESIQIDNNSYYSETPSLNISGGKNGEVTLTYELSYPKREFPLSGYETIDNYRDYFTWPEEDPADHGSGQESTKITVKGYRLDPRDYINLEFEQSNPNITFDQGDFSKTSSPEKFIADTRLSWNLSTSYGFFLWTNGTLSDNQKELRVDDRATYTFSNTILWSNLSERRTVGTFRLNILDPADRFKNLTFCAAEMYYLIDKAKDEGIEYDPVSGTYIPKDIPNNPAQRLLDDIPPLNLQYEDDQPYTKHWNYYLNPAEMFWAGNDKSVKRVGELKPVDISIPIDLVIVPFL